MLDILFLTSRKSYLLFILFFFIGCISIILNKYPVQISVLCVIFYSLILFISQYYLLNPLSHHIKNTPYFMGFLFTLASLVNIFYNLPLISCDNNFSLLVPQVGTAIFTTIIGLLMRELLISFDKSVELEEKIYHSLSEELRENIATYRKAQQKLMAVIDEFTIDHKKLLVIEQQASKEHIDMLTKSSRALSNIAKKYPDKIMAFLNELDSIHERAKEFLNDFYINTLEEFKDKYIEESQKVQTDFNNKTKKFSENIQLKITLMSEKLEETISLLKNKIKELPTIFDEPFNSLSSKITETFDDITKKLKLIMENNIIDISPIKTSIDNIISNINQLNQLLNDNIIAKIKLIDSSVFDINNRFKEIETNINPIPSQMEDFVNTVDNINKIQEEKLEFYRNEIKEIDNLINDFIEVVKKRLSS